MRRTDPAHRLIADVEGANFGKIGECVDDDLRERITNTLIGLLPSSFVIWLWAMFYRLN